MFIYNNVIKNRVRYYIYAVTRTASKLNANNKKNPTPFYAFRQIPPVTPTPFRLRITFAPPPPNKLIKSFAVARQCLRPSTPPHTRPSANIVSTLNARDCRSRSVFPPENHRRPYTAAFVVNHENRNTLHADGTSRFFSSTPIVIGIDQSTDGASSPILSINNNNNNTGEIIRRGKKKGETTNSYVRRKLKFLKRSETKDIFYYFFFPKSV